MSWIDLETSAEDSEPREGYEFQLPAVTYRLTDGAENVVIGGATYVASQVGRTSLSTSTNTTGGNGFTITLPVAHAICQRYLRNGIPPRSVGVVVRRSQASTGDAEIVWRGDVISASVEGNLMHFVAPSKLDTILTQRLPVALVGKTCPHVLYDAQCRVSRGSFTRISTITAIDGDEVSSNDTTMPNGWATYGEAFHPLSGESLTVIGGGNEFVLGVPVGVRYKLQFPLFDANVGDQIYFYAGCDHLIATCHSKFANRANFGGSNLMPFKNPWYLGNRNGVAGGT